jgi:zinc protease
MILDRTIAPSPVHFHSINLPALDRKVLSNGMPLFIIASGQQPVLRFELIFEAGNKYDEIIGQSFFTTKMMAEGTLKHTSTEIAEQFASIGYFYEFTQGSERAVFTLNGLTKHFRKAISILQDLILNSVFPENELSNLKIFSKQQLAVNLEKTAYLASISFKENIFGNQHYIGRNMNETDIEAITSNDLIDFFQKNILNKAFRIFIAGQISGNEINDIEEYFGQLKTNKNQLNAESIAENNYEGKQIFIEKIGAIQASIRIGCRIIDRSHPDYFPFKIANTILGGYFGSRLMRNIREDKGYTYGISASHLPIPNHAYFLIGTDVKGEFAQNTISEIYKEMVILQTELVAEDELEVVKNFLMGDYAGSLNSPFDIADKHKMLIYENLETTFFDNYIQNINKVTSSQVLEMAQKYFVKQKMIEIIVGSK